MAFVCLAACGSHSTPSGPTPTSGPPQIACPADLTVSGVMAAMQAVSYDAPKVTDGAAPVTTTCTPASGTAFALGTTAVSCSATDAQARKATCSFNVTLKGLLLGAARFVAYGDSITEGETGRPNIAPTFLDTPNAYPTKLQADFDAAYPGQGIVVVNRGHSGDPVESLDGNPNTTLNVIIGHVAADRPDAVLLLSGYNNLTNPCAPGRFATAGCNEQMAFVPIGLRDCIHRTRELSPSTKYIFLGTLTPPGPSGSNRIDPAAIVQTNAGIRQLAAAEAVTLVDSYAAFAGHEGDYVNVDGLHLRPAGYQALADAFFTAIQRTIPQTALFGLPPLH